MSKAREFPQNDIVKLELKAIDLIVISAMDKHTGDYENLLVTNRPRWKKDTELITDDTLLRIEIFHLGKIKPAYMFHSKEDFENAVNL